MYSEKKYERELAVTLPGFYNKTLDYLLQYINQSPYNPPIPDTPEYSCSDFHLDQPIQVPYQYMVQARVYEYAMPTNQSTRRKSKRHNIFSYLYSRCRWIFLEYGCYMDDKEEKNNLTSYFMSKKKDNNIRVKHIATIAKSNSFRQLILKKSDEFENHLADFREKNGKAPRDLTVGTILYELNHYQYR